LAKAAPTFNNIPLLNQHIAVDVEDHHPDAVVGSTGTDCQFIAPYLQNSLVVWTEAAIEAIELNEQKELSCMYRYRAVMTPGIDPDGFSYDGIMVDIVGNHVALVPLGRAGRDIKIGDSALKLNIEANMKNKTGTLSKMGAFVKGTFMGADSAINVSKLLDGLTAANWPQRSEAIKTAVIAGMAADAAQDWIESAFAALTAEAVLMAADEDEDDEDAKKKKAALTAEKNKKPAEDEDDKVSKGAMDSALRAIEASTVKRMTALHKAMKDVTPYVGDVEMAADSAEGIYGEALKILKVDVTDVHPSAFGTILKMQPLPGVKVPGMAADAAPISTVESLAKKLPGYTAMKQV
jgi:hypothetical protein